jgi:imidazolonepropionase-like amidohydrolase
VHNNNNNIGIDHSSTNHCATPTRNLLAAARPRRRAKGSAQAAFAASCNCDCWRSAGSVLADRDLLLQNGVVAAIDLSGRVSAPSDAIAIDCRGRFVTPGIVDMHSHAGVGSYPSTFGTEDVNEMTNPTTPQVRAIDGFNPHDPALDDIVAGGVTTIQVIPGSGNAMGGQGAVFKVWPRRSGRAVIPRMHVVDNRVHLKMACGENVKRVYGRRGAMPMSRHRLRVDHARQIRGRRQAARAAGPLVRRSRDARHAARPPTSRCRTLCACCAARRSSTCTATKPRISK